MKRNIFQESIDNLREIYDTIHFEVIETPHDVTDGKITYSKELNLYSLFIPRYESTSEKLFYLGHNFMNVLISRRYSEQDIDQLQGTEEWLGVLDSIEEEVYTTMDTMPMQEGDIL